MEKVARVRGTIKRKVTNFNNFVSSIDADNTTNQQIEELRLRIKQFESYMIEFEDVQSKIEGTCEEQDLEQNYQYRDQFTNDYSSLLAKASSIIKKVDNVGPTTTSISNITTNDNSSYHTGVKLPIINLPKFNGNYNTWLNYKDTYESLIHNNDAISSIQKYHYLRASLEADPLKIIQALEFSSSNYIVAWDLLCNRYNNHRLLVHNHVKSLFNLESLQKATAAGIRNIIDSLAEHMRALCTLKEPVNFWDTLLIYLISTKLDRVTFAEWEKHKISNTPPKLSELVEFLSARAEWLETLDFKSEINKDRVNRKASLTVTESCCNYCKKSHKIYSCNDFLKLNVPERIKEVKRLNLCENCLWFGHNTAKCKGKCCKKCNKKHNSLLHIDPVMPAVTNASNDSEVAASAQVSLSSHVRDKQVVLSTIMLNSFDNKGNMYSIRALLDCGSQSHFITQDLCHKLNLKPTPTNISIYGINNCSSLITGKCTLNIGSCHSNYQTKLVCYVIPKITSEIPAEPLEVSHWGIPENLPLADPNFHLPGNIDLLIGAGLFWNILSKHSIKLGTGLPILHSTSFGWVISGSLNEPTQNSTNCYFTKHSSLNDDLTSFWEIEEIPQESSLTHDDLQCEQHFLLNTYRNEEGRFVVKIPFKHPPSLLGNSREQAIKRLLTLEKRFESQPFLKSSYVQFMNEYNTLNHMSLVNDSNQNDCYFLPHHGVVRNNSLTTKLRVVFDGSSNSTSGVSLNDLQFIGPPIINDLFSILLRFRQYVFVVISDIIKMYRQILINSEDRRYQQIVWRDSPDKDISTYQLNTVTYGTTSAPYLAMKCLSLLADIHKEKYPLASTVIRRDFYVDDLITGANSEGEIITVCREITKILHSAKFPLQKWHSNSLQVLKELQHSQHTLNVIPIGDHSVKTLGVRWNSKLDKLTFEISKAANREVTKRTVLSIVAQVFDPLGLISPTIVLAKILVQKLWTLKLNWDEPIPEDLLKRWEKYQTGLHTLNEFAIERNVFVSKYTYAEIHAFCDASQDAYAAVVYVRSINDNNQIQTNLLCSKTRVSPLKQVTIPRLELCSALLLAKLVNKVQSSLTVKCTPFLWSDSQIVLAWLKTNSRSLHTFVGNRVAKIQLLTEGFQWLHVPSKQNPADLASRGVLPNVLINNDLWWHGTDWLSFPKEKWPEQIRPSVEILELKRSSTFAVTKREYYLFNKYSSFTKLQRVLAWCLRFATNCRSPLNKRNYETSLNITELKNSTINLVRLSQLHDFSNEIEILKAGRLLKGSSIIKLAPFLDENGLLRVGGRLRNSNLSNNAKNPWLLNGNHPLVTFLMEKEHKALLHAGPQLLLAHIRQNFWPTSGIQIAERTVRKCIKCFHFRPKNDVPIMADLPKSRVVASYPFATSGVDCAGPFQVKDRKGRGAKVTKHYICLFVCFVSKSIHLELVSELTAACFISCLRRFVARRGKPCMIVSDNGTNFVGAANELKRLQTFWHTTKNEVLNHCSETGIIWSFNPPKSPHFGGIWESEIKCVKRHLLKIIGDTKLTYEEFNTTIIQIESILNSRPLHPLSIDPNDLDPLTPFHFLIGRSIAYIPEINTDNIPMNRLKRYKMIQQLQRCFWKRWTRDYLSHLQKRNKWASPSRNLQVGNLVFLKDANLHPYQWPLGRITEIFPGHDGNVRVVNVKTKKVFLSVR